MSDKKAADGLSAEERQAVKDRAKELRAQAKAGKSREAGTKSLNEVIAKLEGTDKDLAEGLVKVVTEVAPHLVPKTYYGMPGFANDAGKMVVFVQPAGKFGTRYPTIGFEDTATLDDGDIWPIGFGVARWSETTESTVTDLVRKATSA